MGTAGSGEGTARHPRRNTVDVHPFSCGLGQIPFPVGAARVRPGGLWPLETALGEPHFDPADDVGRCDRRRVGHQHKPVRLAERRVEVAQHLRRQVVAVHCLFGADRIEKCRRWRERRVGNHFVRVPAGFHHQHALRHRQHWLSFVARYVGVVVDPDDQPFAERVRLFEEAGMAEVEKVADDVGVEAAVHGVGSAVGALVGLGRSRRRLVAFSRQRRWAKR